MAMISATSPDLGAFGDAVVHETLGRGHLALHDWGLAVTELAQAEREGLDTPELHAAHGRALGELYHQAVEEARRNNTGKESLARREKELETQYLAPALAELEHARGAADDVEALIALYRHDYATAKTRALAVARTSPWSYETRKLAADAVYAAAVADVDRGNYDAARIQLDEASRLYVRAIDAARSDASTYEAAAQAKRQRGELDWRQNHAEKIVFDEADALIDSALIADPVATSALTTKAYIENLRNRAQVDANRVPVLEASAAAAQRAIEIDPGDAGAWDALGNAHLSRGIYEAFHAGNGLEWWRKALVDLGHALAIRPNDPWFNNDAGLTHRWIGAAIADSGGDPSGEFRLALEHYQRATATDPSYVFAWSNEVDLMTTLATYQLGMDIDPSAAVKTALDAGARCLTLDANFALALQNMSDATLTLARYQIDHGSVPDKMIETARAHLDRVDKVSPNDMFTWFERSRAARYEAMWLIASNRDAKAAVAAAKEASSRAIELIPSSVGLWVERAEGELVGQDLVAARTDADKAISLDDSDLSAQIIAGEIAAAEVRAGNATARPRAVNHLDRALSIDPTSRRAKLARDALH